MFSLGVTCPQQRILTAAAGGCKVEPRRIAASAKASVSALHCEIRTVASVADHTTEDGIRVRRREIFDPEMAREAAFCGQLSCEGPDFDDPEVSFRERLDVTPNGVLLCGILLGCEVSIEPGDREGCPFGLESLPFRMATTDFH